MARGEKLRRGRELVFIAGDHFWTRPGMNWFSPPKPSFTELASGLRAFPNPRGTRVLFHSSWCRSFRGPFWLLSFLFFGDHVPTVPCFVSPYPLAWKVLEKFKLLGRFIISLAAGHCGRGRHSSEMFIFGTILSKAVMEFRDFIYGSS